MMPVAFIGHGSPMNAIESNDFTRGWQEIAASIPKPTAILSISAHWVTERTHLLTEANPRTIHDFYGFPKELYQIQYKAPGAPDLANQAKTLIGGTAQSDDDWGLDHGTWSVLKNMYPAADIPVFQMSIDELSDSQTLFEIGQRLKPLREQNVLILGSGNVVHNLSLASSSTKGGYDWAYEFDDFIRENIEKRAYENVVHYQRAGKCAEYAFFTSEHFNPLLYVLGAVDAADNVKLYNHSCIAGSLSMTSYVFA